MSTQAAIEAPQSVLTLKAIRTRHAQSEILDTDCLADDESYDNLHRMLDVDGSDTESSTCSIFSESGEADDHSNLQDNSSPSCTQAEAVISQEPISRYHVISELCRSLFGTVVLALDTTSNQEVAIKLSNTDLVQAGISSTGCTVMEDPLFETSLLRRLPSHPCIVSLQREHVIKNVHWAVLEYVPNGDLFEHLLQHGLLQQRVAQIYVHQIAQALLHMHSHGVCHLDVSLENILLDANYNLKLTDFGVARIFGQSESSVFPGITGRNKPGKLRYMAPEMLAGQDFDGCLVDSFALGVVMFCLLTGSAPFEAARADDPRWCLLASGDFDAFFAFVDVSIPDINAVDLLKSLLTTADKRISIAAVLQHPWFSQDA